MDKTTLELAGYGYGYGSGSGDGSGSGYGGKSYFQAILAPYIRNPNRKVCFWRSNSNGHPANGGNGTIAKIGLTETVEGPLQICTRNALHGTVVPQKWKGEKWWVVELHEPIVNQEDKYASLTRTFLADLGKCPF